LDVGCKPEKIGHLEVAILKVAKNDVSYDEPSQPYLHDASLLNGKNQIADDAGIRKKIGSQILNFRIIIFEFQRIRAKRSKCAAWFFHFRSIELL
jgi:hypothetical protein